jgi:hypothetical protein
LGIFWKKNGDLGIFVGNYGDLENSTHGFHWGIHPQNSKNDGEHNDQRQKLGIVPIAGKLDMENMILYVAPKTSPGHGDNFGGCTRRKIRET